MLLNDAYAGHRKWWRADWVPTPALASVWTEWDYILVRVSQYIEDYTNVNGHLVWLDEDPDVWWDIDTATSTYAKDTHEYTENHEIKEWESLRAVPRWDDDKEAPSMEKWLRRMEEDDHEPSDRPQGSRPPTPEELAALMRPREENA
jgi:hypothetical protein